MAGLPDRFLFINKSAHSKSLSHSNGDERFDLQSHVQSRHNKTDYIPILQIETSFTQKLFKRGQVLQLRNQKTSRTKQGSAKIAASSTKHSSVNRSETDSCLSLAPTRQIRVERPLTRNAFDPIQSASTPMDAATHHILKYPFTGFLERTFKAEALCLDLTGPQSKSDFRHSQAMANRLRCCVEDPLTMYATLSYSASCLRWAVGQNEGQTAPETFTVKAIERLRDRLNRMQNVDVYLIISIYALGAAEMWNQNPEGARAHLEAVKNCVAQFGGMKKLEPYIRESLILADKYTALLQLTSPVLPLDWDPGPLDENKYRKTIENEMSSSQSSSRGFLCRGAEAGLSPALLKIIDDILQCVNFAQFFGELADGDEEWLFLRHQSFIYRLLSFKADNDTLDECCRLALIAWLLKITAYFGAQRASKRILPRLKIAILSLRYGNDPQERFGRSQMEILFWTTSVGAMTAEYTEERDWFIAETSRVAEVLKIKAEKEAFRSLLERYLFLDCESGLNFKRMVRAVREFRGEPVPYV